MRRKEYQAALDRFTLDMETLPFEDIEGLLRAYKEFDAACEKRLATLHQHITTLRIWAVAVWVCAMLIGLAAVFGG